MTPDPIGLAGGINLFQYASNNPVNYIDPYGLIEGSPSNMAKRAAIAAWAAAQNGSSAFALTSIYAPGYSYDAKLGPQYPTDSYKCSGFTCAAAASAGADTKVTVIDNQIGTVDRCPTAAELANGPIPNWRKLAPGEKPEPGDIVAAPWPGQPEGATGHAAVVIVNPRGGTTTMGAHRERVGPAGTDRFSRPRTYRRYTGD